MHMHIHVMISVRNGNENIQREADVIVNSFFKSFLGSAISGEFDSILDVETKGP